MNHEVTKITKDQEEVLKMELSTFHHSTVIAYFSASPYFSVFLRAFVVKIIAVEFRDGASFHRLGESPKRPRRRTETVHLPFATTQRR